MNINLKWIFIFICFLSFLSLSNVYAFEENNSTDLLQEDNICEPVLCENITNMNDTRINTYLNSSDVVKYYHDSERYGVYLFDDGGNALSNKNISFIINGMTYKRITNDYGYASMVINLNSGNYSASCFFNGDDYYKPCNCSNWIFVNSTIFADDLVKYFHNSSQYYSLFFSVNGIPLVNTTVTFNINGVFYNRTTNNSGWARLNINLNPGEYIITAYNPVSGEMHSNNITVLPILIAEDLYMGYRDGSCFEAIVLDNRGNPYPNQTVTFNINGIFYNRTSDLYGVARLNINLMSGEYIITSYFNGAAIANRIVVGQSHFPISYSLIANNCNFYYGGDNIFEVRLVDNYGNFIPNKSILLTYNDYSLASMTDENGYAKWFIDWDVGSYDVSLSFRSNYPNDIINNNFKHINIYKSNIILYNNSSLSQYCGNSSFLYSVNVCDYFNHELCGLNISFNIENNTFYNVTNEEGIALCSFDLDVGEYTLNVSFKSNDNFNPSFLVQNITVMNSIYVDKQECFYNQSNVTINIISNLNDFYYSFDNISWVHRYENTSILFMNGKWDLYYCNDFSNIHHYSFVVDNKSPIVFASKNSGIYKDSFYVNLTVLDNTDDNPLIYYSLNNFSYSLYNESILISNSSNLSVLNFYSIDKFGHKSEFVSANYFFNVCVANLNSAKSYSTIQNAIDDNDTKDGDLIIVSEGIYNEHLTINKFINLIAINATLYSIDSYQPVIRITKWGSNSTIQGFKINDSDYGIVLNQAENVSIVNNQFINVISSIETDHDKNTFIAYNSIESNKILNSMTGITIRNSENNVILNNNISLNSMGNVSGIFVLNNTSSNISILNNKIINKNKLNGIGLYIICSNMNIDSNNISDFNTGLYMISSNSKVLNNEFQNNQYGVFLRVSLNNTYAFNNIHDNKLCGFVLDESLLSYNDSFYLNRLCYNTQYDFYSQANCSYVINNNWWGKNIPKISINRNVVANIYNATGNLIIDSWIVAQLFSSSYKINEHSQIERVKFHIDLTYNNLEDRLSPLGYIPNNIESFISIFNIDGDYKSNTSYLKDGKAFVDFELTDLLENHTNIEVMAIFDNEKIIKTFNKNATIDITLFSKAEEAENNNFINKTYHIPFTNNVSWITFSWGETGLYTGKIYVIVNGEIIDEINITNIAYQIFKDNYSTKVFEAVKLLNNVFASMKEGIWAPNGYYLSFANQYNLDANNSNLVYNRFLDYLQSDYNLTEFELDFIKTYKNYFINRIGMEVDYHGDITPDINFEYDGEHKFLNLPSSFAYRISNIYYTDIVDENDISIGYEGMRSFAIAKGNVTDNDLRYWLDQKDLYAPGLMKAAYGTFLTPLLVIYENDRVADESANKFNVTWSRVSPVCVSLCNDYNCVYITGESNHLLGREAKGNVSDVWKFNFATSFSFSLIEQLVGNNVWNSTNIDSVTLGLIESYLNNETLEIFVSNGYIFIKHYGDNSTLLFLDLETGIVRDCFSYYGVVGTIPCYHDNITDNAWNYGNNLLNHSSQAYADLKNIFSISILSSALAEGGVLALEGYAGLLLGTMVFIAIPLFIIFRPDDANELWKEFVYLLNPNYKEYPDITIPENTYQTQHSFTTTNVLLNTNSDLNDIGIILTMTKKYDPNIIKLDIGEIKSIQSGGSSDPDDNIWEQVGEKYKEVKDDLKDAIHKKDVKRIVIDTFLLGAIIATVFAYITDVNIDEVSNSLIKLSNNFMENFHEIFI